MLTPRPPGHLETLFSLPLEEDTPLSEALDNWLNQVLFTGQLELAWQEV